jgi:hypothetical protein
MHTQSGSGLQLQDVNTFNLDSLVLDYLAAEDFVVEVRQHTEQSAHNRCAAMSEAHLGDLVLVPHLLSW